MLGIVDQKDISTVFDRYKKQELHCGFGVLGLCCKNCNFGPCRIDPFAEEPSVGVCGADANVIAARNLVRHVTAGSACHSDHGRELAKLLLLIGEGKAPGYKVKDEKKLKKIAEEYKINIENKAMDEIAVMLGKKLLDEYGQQEGEINLMNRAPEKQKGIWRKNKFWPRGIDREIVENMARTNMGVDNDYKNLIAGGIRCSLADGWGGSMIGTDVSDIIFGSPQPIRSISNLGVLKEDAVNIVLHGHVPILSDMICDAALNKEIIDYVNSKGIKGGINIVGICCTANEILMRRGIPVAGNMLQQELAIMTGVVDLMVVDLQCIMPGLQELLKCYHTRIISTSSKARFPGFEYIEFKEEGGLDIAKRILKIGVDNYSKRVKELINIPKEKMDLIAGFTTENISTFLGGKYRATYRPLNDAIISGRLRGVVGVVGCNNPKFGSGRFHIDLVKELIKKDVLVLQTGCAALECAKEGLLRPESAKEFAGKGLQEICETVGIPPVLHVGSCVDNSRILTACIEMVKEGGVGEGLDELPIAGAAPEWMSEKAIAIGFYFVASGALVVLGGSFPVTGAKNLTKFITEDVEKITGGRFSFCETPKKMTEVIIAHLNKKRETLKLKPMMYEK